MNLEMANYPSEPSAITKVITKSEAGKPGEKDAEGSREEKTSQGRGVRGKKGERKRDDRRTEGQRQTHTRMRAHTHGGGGRERSEHDMEEETTKTKEFKAAFESHKRQGKQIFFPTALQNQHSPTTADFSHVKAKFGLLTARTVSE